LDKRINPTLKTGFFICFAAGAVFCGHIDTVIIADGGPGPYGLGRYFIDTSTIRVDLAGPVSKDSTSAAPTTSPYIPVYTFINEENALLFSEPLRRGAKLHVRCETYNYGLPRMYSLFEKRFASSRDTVILIRDSLFRAKTNEFAEENLTLSGYKSINISVGSVGSMNLEQALDVSLSGDVAPQTTLSGHLTDQGTTIEGTRELSDFDRIYVALENPRYSLTVGDQYMLWPVAGGIFSGQKKLKGISAGLMQRTADVRRGVLGSTYNVQGFGAICGGKFTVQTIKGKAGLQGPYYLSGVGEQGFIMPVRGTVSITINGRKCAEGDQGEFLVDYELGSLTFTPRVLINEDDIIRVEYEYRLFDYQRTLVGASVETSMPDSSIQVDGGVWYETDDKNRPLENSISQDDRIRMEQSGDSPPLHPSGREILPVDVARESQLRPLYTLDSLGHYVFTAFDPKNPARIAGFYAVWFRETGAGTGAYIADRDTTAAHPELRSIIYRYVGQGRGTATDSAAIPLPQSVTNGEVRVSLRPLSWVSANVDIAGMDNDKNVASSRDDNDNSGSASDVRLTLGRKTETERSLWVSGSHLYITPRFTREVLSTYQGDQQWDDTTGDIRSGRRQTWQTSVGATLLPGVSAELYYGQFRRDNVLHTDRVGGSGLVTLWKDYSLNYQGSLFRHLLGGDRTWRNSLEAAARVLSTDCKVSARDEWREYPVGGNRGEAGAAASVSSDFLSLKESATYLLHKKGTGTVFEAADTGRSVSWDQSISRALLPSWRVEATSHYLNLDVFNVRQTSTMLVTAQSDVSLPDNGFTTHQEYRVNVEKASSYQKIGVYVGPGRGDAVWSDSLRDYIPKANGDYYLQQRELYDSIGDDRARKTRLVVNWSFSPVKKYGARILNDLSWYGSLTCEEHLSLATALPAASWLPGYLSLFSGDGLADTARLRLSDLSYRQNVEWNPDSLPGWNGKLYAEPFAKKFRDYYESGVDWGGSIVWTRGAWNMGVDGAMLSVWRHGFYEYNQYTLADRHGQATEKYDVIRPLTLYVKETAGWGGQTGISSAGGWYYQIVPGVEWRIFDKGSLEVSYTYSFVGLEGIVDPRIAQGFTSGNTHTIKASARADFASHFSIDLSYHGEIGKNYYNATGLHVLSMQVKAYL
jgi:hypothetical protein